MPNGQSLQQKLARIKALESDRAAYDRGEKAAGSPAQSFSALAAGDLAGKGLKGFKKGGKVKKSGVYKLHKGEKVLTAKQAKKPTVKKAAAKLRGRRI